MLVVWPWLLLYSLPNLASHPPSPASSSMTTPSGSYGSLRTISRFRFSAYPPIFQRTSVAASLSSLFACPLAQLIFLSPYSFQVSVFFSSPLFRRTGNCHKNKKTKINIQISDNQCFVNNSAENGDDFLPLIIRHKENRPVFA